jgi:hypothetical protein
MHIKCIVLSGMAVCILERVISEDSLCTRNCRVYLTSSPSLLPGRFEWIVPRRGSEEKGPCIEIPLN